MSSPDGGSVLTKARNDLTGRTCLVRAIDTGRAKDEALFTLELKDALASCASSGKRAAIAFIDQSTNELWSSILGSTQMFLCLDSIGILSDDTSVLVISSSKSGGGGRLDVMRKFMAYSKDNYVLYDGIDDDEALVARSDLSFDARECSWEYAGDMSLVDDGALAEFEDMMVGLAELRLIASLCFVYEHEMMKCFDEAGKNSGWGGMKRVVSKWLSCAERASEAIFCGYGGVHFDGGVVERACALMQDHHDTALSHRRSLGRLSAKTPLCHPSWIPVESDARRYANMLSAQLDAVEVAKNIWESALEDACLPLSFKTFGMMPSENELLPTVRCGEELMAIGKVIGIDTGMRAWREEGVSPMDLFGERVRRSHLS